MKIIVKGKRSCSGVSTPKPLKVGSIYILNKTFSGEIRAPRNGNTVPMVTTSERDVMTINTKSM
jgi:hypothetical protein